MRFVKQIEDYWDATEEFSRDDQNQAGFIASVGTGPVKGGKTSWSAIQLWKGVVARRAKEKCTKDSDFNSSVVNSESLVGTVIGVGESAIKSPVLVLTRVHEEQSISGPVAKRHS